MWGWFARWWMRTTVGSSRNPRTLTLTVGPDLQPMAVQWVPQVWIGTRSDDGLIGAR